MTKSELQVTSAPKIQKGEVLEKQEDKFSWKQSCSQESTHCPCYKIYLLIFKPARWEITEKVLDKIKQQLDSISVIQFVFSLKYPFPVPV